LEAAHHLCDGRVIGIRQRGGRSLPWNLHRGS
jgi:hypothetical protein